jgi:uncharacterized protein YjbI with pentapeptide repeats
MGAAWAEIVWAWRFREHADLAGAYLARADLTGANLARANLACANLARTDLAGANLAGANLAGAYLAGADLAGANLARANLAGAYLAGANLAGANLSRANLAGANLSRAYLTGANLSRADLLDAYLAGADLAGANLSRADLAGANLARANLAGANLAGAYLAGADLAGANLAGANLLDADLSGANLAGANLSRALGLRAASSYFDDLERDDLGFIVYKRIDMQRTGFTQYNAPDTWKIEPGAIIEEIPDPSRTVECGCGVNFGTLEWCKSNYTSATLWRCRIRYEWLAGVVVPYHTDGKAPHYHPSAHGLVTPPRQGSGGHLRRADAVARGAAGAGRWRANRSGDDHETSR